MFILKNKVQLSGTLFPVNFFNISTLHTGGGRAPKGHAPKGHALKGHALKGHALKGHAPKNHLRFGVVFQKKKNICFDYKNMQNDLEFEVIF